MELRSNDKIELAREFILNTSSNIYLTGRAGTGKTTLLRSVITQLSKRAVVAAPTGIAALNAGGVTLHSLFQLPFGVHLPGTKIVTRYGRDGASFGQRISKAKLAIIRSIELLVIDEVSMVRCDLLDAIDQTLRTVRRNSHPFGGVQLLLIGDIQQLAPICRDDEWDMLREHYANPYFFESKALQRVPYVTIELDEIFRQSDTRFTDILNAVRENRATPAILEELNRRYIPDFAPSDSDDYIILTTHNHTANGINSRKLAAIRSEAQYFDAKVSGDFQESAYPNDTKLELKIGAQVLFIKNDITPQKRFYNGMLGVITGMNEKCVTVQPKLGGVPIVVERVAWESTEYQVNRESGVMEQIVKGTFSQMPLKCAWAITIHKSQGLSFDRAVIDASDSFAHGQLYVALSRCRTLEGMVLRKPLSISAIVGDNNIENFCSYVSRNQPTDEILRAYKRDYYSRVVCEIFDFEATQRLLWDLMSEISGAVSRSYPKLTANLMELLAEFDKSVVKVGTTFQSQLRMAIYGNDNYAEDKFIEERLRKAAEYFAPRLESLKVIASQLEQVNPDSAETKRRIVELTTRIKSQSKLLFISLELCATTFCIESYQEERAKLIAKESVESSEKRTESKKTQPKEKRSVKVDGDIVHQELYDTLAAWRLEEAREQKIAAFRILSHRTLINIQDALPTTEETLSEVSGIGKIMLKRYGDQIIEIVKEYCFSNSIEPKK